MKNILITRFSALGDVAMAVSVVYDVCRLNPDKSFFFLTRKVPASLFVNPPSNLQVLTVNLNDYKGAGGIWRLAAELKEKYNIEAYADLHDVLRSKLLRLFMRLKGVKIAKIHKDRAARRALTRSRNKVMRPLKNSRVRYREVFECLGLKSADEFVSVFGSNASADTSLFARATEPKQPTETWIAVAPFAQHGGKVYPLHLMEQVVDRLVKRSGYKIFLMGAGEHESSVFAQWCNKYGTNLINMAAMNLGLHAELALLSGCNLMLSMDSANMHIASLVGLRVVGVWGATHPYCGFFGLNQREEDIVQLDMECRPCAIYGNKPCRYGDYRCLANISPELILTHIDRALDLGKTTVES